MSVAARSEPGLAAARSSPARTAPALYALLALVLVAASAEIVLDAAQLHSPLVPHQPSIAGWLSGVGERLGFRVFLIALLAASAAYAGVLALALRSRGSVSVRAAIALVAVLQLVVFAGPVLLSTDVFSYIAYARMGVEHGVNPYLHGPSAIAGDPVYRYVGQVWRHTATAYGPLYTLLSSPRAPLGLVGALWGMKTLALIAGAGTLWLTWRCARARGLDPVLALLAVGANPLYVLYGLGGAHNDMLMLLIMMGAVGLTVLGPRPTGRRDAGATALIVAGALVKATVAALNRDAALVSSDSFATEIAHLFGKPGVFPADHALLKALLVLIVVHLLWRTWRGYDWIAASGWALLAISVTSTWLLAWYILWPLPLALVVRDRRLLWATLGVQALFVAHQISPLLVTPVQ